MLISLQLDSTIPLYEQLRNEIVLGIAKGTLSYGEKLPTVRQLAEELGINTMTVNKSYALLKQEGYIVIDRRHGAKVSGATAYVLDAEYEAKLENKLELMIAEAVVHGMTHEQFQKLCTSTFSQMNTQS